MSARADAADARELARLYCPPAQRAVFDALTGIETEIRAGLDRRLANMPGAVAQSLPSR